MSKKKRGDGVIYSYRTPSGDIVTVRVANPIELASKIGNAAVLSIQERKEIVRILREEIELEISVTMKRRNS